MVQGITRGFHHGQQVLRIVGVAAIAVVRVEDRIGIVGSAQEIVEDRIVSDAGLVAVLHPAHHLQANSKILIDVHIHLRVQQVSLQAHIGIVLVGVGGGEHSLVVHIAQVDHIPGDGRSAGGIEVQTGQCRGAAQNSVVPIYVGMADGIGMVAIGVEIGLAIDRRFPVVLQGLIQQVGILVSRQGRRQAQGRLCPRFRRDIQPGRAHAGFVGRDDQGAAAAVLAQKKNGQRIFQDRYRLNSPGVDGI